VLPYFMEIRSATVLDGGAVSRPTEGGVLPYFMEIRSATVLDGGAVSRPTEGGGAPFGRTSRSDGALTLDYAFNLYFRTF